MEKLTVRVSSHVDPLTGEEIENLPHDVLYEKMAEAGWSDDPGTGKAILDPWGREILSPMPVAPPIGYVSEPSVMDRLAQMLDARMRLLQDDDVVDESEEEANDFEIDDPEDIHPRSVYEIQLVDEVPALPRSVPQGEGRSGTDVPPAGESSPEASLKQPRDAVAE